VIETVAKLRRFNYWIKSSWLTVFW